MLVLPIAFFLLLVITESQDDRVAIKASEYASKIGRGFDVDWSKSTQIENIYSEDAVIAFKEKGFTHFRIRMTDPEPDEAFMTSLTQQVDDVIKHDLYPILAYGAPILEEQNFTIDDAKNHLAGWWGKMARHFKDHSYNLAFNILIQISGHLKDDYESVNKFYKAVHNRVRNNDEKRVLIFPPVHLSNPNYLQYLEIPGEDDSDEYTMAEWHFFASGPNPDPKSKKYWIDGKTQTQRDSVLVPLNVALDWMNQTGYSTWVGAWMTGNYNEGDTYNIVQQVQFGSFMARTLKSKGINWALNAGKHFYDYREKEWYIKSQEAPGGIAIIDALIDPDTICVYNESNYRGDSFRLGLGEYTYSDLQDEGFTFAGSIMIPIDYKVTLYSEDNFTGNSIVLQKTMQNNESFDVKSIKIVYESLV